MKKGRYLGLVHVFSTTPSNSPPNPTRCADRELHPRGRGIGEGHKGEGDVCTTWLSDAPITLRDSSKKLNLNYPPLAGNREFTEEEAPR